MNRCDSDSLWLWLTQSQYQQVLKSQVPNAKQDPQEDHDQVTAHEEESEDAYHPDQEQPQQEQQ